MTIIHIVLFKLKSSLSEIEVQEFCNDMLELKNTCVHPKDGTPYILQSSGGKDNSPEGAQGGFTHGFVVEFFDSDDRDYYINGDPSHKAFVEKNSPRFEDVRVIDYEKGVF